MRTPDPLRPITLALAAAVIGFLAVGPLVFPIDWAFHIFPDTFPAIQRMHGLGLSPKLLWVICGPLGVVAAALLIRRPLAGFVASVLFAAIYVPTAIALWGQFSFGSWAAIAAALLAGFGLVQARRLTIRSSGPL